MRIDVLTLFPDFVQQSAALGVVGRAGERAPSCGNGRVDHRRAGKHLFGERDERVEIGYRREMRSAVRLADVVVERRALVG